MLSTFSTLLVRGREENKLFFKIEVCSKYFVQDCLRKMGLCGHSFHVSKLFCAIFSLKFCISVLITTVIWLQITGRWGGGGGGGGGGKVEGDLKQSVNYQLKDFFSFC